MDSINIELAAFSFGEHTSSLRKVFDKLGCRINEVDIRNAANSETSASHALKVVFLDCDAYPRSTLLGFLSDSKNTPTLGVFPCKEIRQDQEVIDHFNDFVDWPCNIQELSIRLERLYKRTERQDEDRRAGKTDNSYVTENLVGQSAVFKEALGQIKQISCFDAPVLIEGETGTGKELAARAIHYLGERKDYPFIPVNCGALPDTLVENELFGHSKGAFTDARTSQAGLISQAEGGTLFLDEVDSLSTKAQVVLLRFLQDFCFRPLGSNKVLQSNVRIVVASNVSLAECVRQGTFREDLFYRVNVLSVKIPSLKERADDIGLLAKHFVKKLQEQYQLNGKDLLPGMYDELAEMEWPGNVRQLENYIHRKLLMLNRPDFIEEEKPKPFIERRKNWHGQPGDDLFECSFNEAKEQVIAKFEKRYLSWLMRETNGNVTHAARKSGKERRALGKLLKKHGIEKNIAN